MALVRAIVGAPADTHSQHAVDTQDGIRNHVADLIEAVVKKFHQARIHEISRRINTTLQANSIRQKSNKLVLFKNQ